jgi:hypothetical protein
VRIQEVRKGALKKDGSIPRGLGIVTKPFGEFIEK